MPGNERAPASAAEFLAINGSKTGERPRIRCSHLGKGEVRLLDSAYSLGAAYASAPTVVSLARKFERVSPRSKSARTQLSQPTIQRKFYTNRTPHCDWNDLRGVHEQSVPRAEVGVRSR